MRFKEIIVAPASMDRTKGMFIKTITMKNPKGARRI
jgi:hypothetical protein